MRSSLLSARRGRSRNSARKVTKAAAYVVVERMEERRLLSGIAFTLDQAISTGYSTRSVAAADLNGDGRTDLVAMQDLSNRISVLLNSDQGFDTVDYYSAGSVPGCAAPGDLDGDGDLDLVIANYDGNSISVYRNNGNGTFAWSADYLVLSPGTVVIADFDGDAKLDVVVSTVNNGTIEFFLNTGNGDEVLSTPTTYAAGGQARGMVTADYNRDGLLDLAVADPAWKTVNVLLNDGNAGFSQQRSYSVGGDAMHVVSADFNGDGYADLATANYEGYSATVLLNTGDGSFGQRRDYQTGSYANGIAAADFDLDGRIDLAVANSGGTTITVLRNDGDGTFVKSVDVSTDHGSSGLVAADLNGDGKSDLAVANYDSGAVAIFRNDSSPPANVAPSVQMNGPAQQHLFFEDFEQYSIGPIDGSGMWTSSGWFVYSHAAWPYYPPLDGDTTGNYLIRENPMSQEGTDWATLHLSQAEPMTTLQLSFNYLLQGCERGRIEVSGNNSTWVDVTIQLGVTPVYSNDITFSASADLTSVIAAAGIQRDLFVRFVAWNPTGSPIWHWFAIDNVRVDLTTTADACTINEGDAFHGSGWFSDPGADIWNATVDYGDGSGVQPLALDADKTFDLSHDYADNGTYVVIVTVMDDNGGVGTDTLTVNVSNVAPVLSIVGPMSVEEGSPYTLNLSSWDPGDDTISSWTIDWGDGVIETVPGNPSGVQHTYVDGFNHYIIIATATDEDGTWPANSIDVDVLNVPPTIQISGQPSIDEGSSYELTLGAVTDPGQDTISQYIVHWGDGTSETYDTPGIKTHVFADGPLAAAITVDLVDEDGTYLAAGSLGATVNNAAPEAGPISAPVDPVLVGTAIVATGTFSDAGIRDTHTAFWDWGDGSTSAGDVVEWGGSGTASGQHIYATAGIYAVRMVVSDDDGGWDESIFQYVVVYDPSAGFVTGGGWINASAGSYAANESVSGRVSFGFVAQYIAGDTAGQTQLQFKIGDLNFHSGSYEWLVVDGGEARFTGSGTVNGVGGYGFMISVIDGRIAGGADCFRIQIWKDGESDKRVFDTQMGSGLLDDATTALGGGSIVIHA